MVVMWVLFLSRKKCRLTSFIFLHDFKDRISHNYIIGAFVHVLSFAALSFDPKLCPIRNKTRLNKRGQGQERIPLLAGFVHF